MQEVLEKTEELREVKPISIKKKRGREITSDLLVFLVDDDRFFLDTLYYYLRDNLSQKIRIRTFSSAEECLESMHEKPDIVVLDYILNEIDSTWGTRMDGLTALKQINKINPETFVIVLSAQENIDVAMDTLREGAYDYLSKSETAIIRLKNTIQNLAETISQSRERLKEEKTTKRINIIVILLLILLFIISRVV